MSVPIELALGDNSVRFTTNGMIFIEDAIEALLRTDDLGPSMVWKKIKEDHPDILDHCDSYSTKEGDLIQTVDMEGLDKIFRFLPEYMY